MGQVCFPKNLLEHFESICLNIESAYEIIFTKGRLRGDKSPCRTLHFCSCLSRSLLFPLSYLSCLPPLKFGTPSQALRCLKIVLFFQCPKSKARSWCQKLRLISAGHVLCLCGPTSLQPSSCYWKLPFATLRFIGACQPKGSLGVPAVHESGDVDEKRTGTTGSQRPQIEV